MPRRSIWSARQCAALLDLPTDEAALLRHYTLSDDDIEQVRLRRGGHNRLGHHRQQLGPSPDIRILTAQPRLATMDPFPIDAPDRPARLPHGS